MKTLNLIISLLIATSLVGCGKGLNTLNNVSSGNLEDGGNGSQTNPDLKTVEFKGRDSRDQNLIFEIDKAAETLNIILPVPGLFLFGLMQGQIPSNDCQGISYKTRTTPRNTIDFVVSVPLVCLMKAKVRDELTLPNGEYLPAFPAGEGTKIAFSFPQKPNYRLHLYLAYGAAAAYIELPDAHIPFGGGPYPLLNDAGTKEVGYLALMAETASSPFGVYVAAHMPPEIAAFFDDYFRFK